ncbi:PREDICTED: cAMP-dependent protein kinase type II-beta regulatory subunit [Phaethon lepturus]|uniref:cAMP-dependent protein kinase type II-beta regulatory subunit n=1 Tax=Phaethon lepturus TaxID=97097 RepID=UPI0005306938|nr:PREDICTED: cAMP-dependent protein kinase type II-beta regulatory subunit [Phaethon lepturus]
MRNSVTELTQRSGRTGRRKRLLLLRTGFRHLCSDPAVEGVGYTDDLSNTKKGKAHRLHRYAGITQSTKQVRYHKVENGLEGCWRTGLELKIILTRWRNGLGNKIILFFFISVCAEAYNPDEEEDDTESRIIHPKTDDQRNRLQEACKDILLFKNLDPEQMSQVLDAMFEKLVEGGEHVIDQGDDGDNFYVIDRGTYDIYVKCDGVGRCVGTYDNRGSFGELALMYNTPRAATIIATSPGAIWGLDRVTFRRIIVKNNAKKRRMYENFIESLPFLKSLEVSERLKVVDVIGTKVYKDGEQIIAQGDLADSFFIVESGEVRIIMTRKGKQDVEENGAVEIARCSRGQYFGELALVTNKPRAASAFALGTVKCLVMDVQAFERLLGPCMEILKRNIANYEEQLVALFGTNMDIADPSA